MQLSLNKSFFDYESKKSINVDTSYQFPSNWLRNDRAGADTGEGLREALRVLLGSPTRLSHSQSENRQGLDAPIEALSILTDISILHSSYNIITFSYT